MPTTKAKAKPASDDVRVTLCTMGGRVLARLRFTSAKWARVEAAAKKSGQTVQEFFHEALLAYFAERKSESAVRDEAPKNP